MRKVKTFVVKPGDENGVNDFLKELAESNIVDADIDIQTVSSGGSGEAVLVILYRVPAEHQTQQWAGFPAP